MNSERGYQDIMMYETKHLRYTSLIFFLIINYYIDAFGDTGNTLKVR